MKKALKFKIKYFLIFFSFQCLFLFNISCGLDTYVVLKTPISTGKEVSYTTTDYSNMYFEFNTNEDPGNYYPKDFTFMGTEVYYKIYSSYTTMNSEVSTLQTLAGSTETSASAPDRMINTVSSGGYGYKTLRTAGNNRMPLIPAKITNYQRVYIRLTNYQNLSDFAAVVTVDGNSIGTPVRYDRDYTFDFGRKGSNDKTPLSSDEDVSYSSTSPDGKWYVAMFAVGVGRDVTYTNQYSNILYLGSVTIDGTKADN